MLSKLGVVTSSSFWEAGLGQERGTEDTEDNQNFWNNRALEEAKKSSSQYVSESTKGEKGRGGTEVRTVVVVHHPGTEPELATGRGEVAQADGQGGEWDELKRSVQGDEEDSLGSGGVPHVERFSSDEVVAVSPEDESGEHGGDGGQDHHERLVERSSEHHLVGLVTEECTGNQVWEKNQVLLGLLPHTPGFLVAVVGRRHVPVPSDGGSGGGARSDDGRVEVGSVSDEH